MRVCVKRIVVLSRWELRRFFEMGGLREILGCATTSVPIALIAALIGEPELVLIVVPMTPLSGVFMPLQGIMKERESGILPALLSSPLTARELALGKGVGHFAIGLILYWTMHLGFAAGFESARILGGAEPADDFDLGTVFILAVALTSVLMVTVAVTVGVCWHVKTTRSAIFWSFLGGGMVIVMAVVLMDIALVAGTSCALVFAFVLAVLTAGLAALHAALLTPEPVLFRWAKKHSRKRRGWATERAGRRRR